VSPKGRREGSPKVIRTTESEGGQEYSFGFVLLLTVLPRTPHRTHSPVGPKAGVLLASRTETRGEGDLTFGPSIPPNRRARTEAAVLLRPLRPLRDSAPSETFGEYGGRQDGRLTTPPTVLLASRTAPSLLGSVGPKGQVSVGVRRDGA
jgi:hypothetical protein